MLKVQDPSLLRTQAFLGGEWIDADHRETMRVTNPATGEAIGTVPMCGTREPSQRPKSRRRRGR